MGGSARACDGRLITGDRPDRPALHLSIVLALVGRPAPERTVSGGRVSDASADRPRRRIFDQVSGAPTLVGAGSEFEGQLRVKGPMSLGGSIVGDGAIDGMLSVAREGHWHGNVSARSAIVAGRITGDLTIDGKLEIGKHAVIRGRVQARIIAIADGAVVDGEMKVTGDEPVVRFEEKRAARAGS